MFCNVLEVFDVFEEYVGKPIRLVKKDGWIKYGLLLEIENGFLKLKYDRNERIEYIAVSQISEISENLNRG